jgi:hypothetical protein
MTGSNNDQSAGCLKLCVDRPRIIQSKQFLHHLSSRPLFLKRGSAELQGSAKWCQGYRQTGVPTVRGTDSQGYRHSGVPTDRCTDSQGYRQTGVPTVRGTDSQGYRQTGVPTVRGTDTQGYRQSGVPTLSGTARRKWVIAEEFYWRPYICVYELKFVW